MKLAAANHTVLGTIEPELLDRLTLSLGDGADWADNGRARALRSQRYTWSLALRENRQTASTQYEEMPVQAEIELQDQPARLLHPTVEPVLARLLELGVGQSFGKIVASWLEARAMVGVHVDPGEYPLVYNRVHVPLVTDPAVIMISEADRFHMERGKIYLLQNQKAHGCINRSHKNRLHLIADLR